MPVMNPEATNLKSSMDSYIFRKFYKENVFPEFGPRFIDYWYDKNLYGRIDRKENTVLPVISNLKQLRSDGGTYMTLNFVADAFSGLQSTFQSALMRRAIRDRGSVYSTLRPKAGWSNGDSIYFTYLRILDELFVEERMIRGNKMKKVHTFNDYLKHYMRFISERADIVPITKTAFIISKYCSPMVGGLIIELSNANHGADILKKDIYIGDLNFKVFRDTARKHGFMVDKNAPWRLTANLASPRMQQYAKKYGITYEPGSASDIFKKQYFEVYKQDIALLFNHIINSYKLFVENFPLVKQVKSKGINQGSFLSRVERTPYSAGDFANRYNEKFLLESYFRLRLIENVVNIPEQKIKDYSRQLAIMATLTSRENMLLAVNRKVLDLSSHRWWKKEITKKAKLAIINITSGC